MGRCLRKCKVLEEEGGGIEKAETAGRKRKVGTGGSQLSTSSFNPKTRRLAVVTPEDSTSAANFGNNLDYVSTSCCSSNGSSEVPASKLRYLQEENEVTGDSLACRERETTSLSEVQAGEQESKPRPSRSNFRRGSIADKMPSEAELEEFFAAAEKNLQKEFIDKYNYDTAKDEPLEGRYEWTQIPPKP